MTASSWPVTALLVEDNDVIGELTLRRMKRFFADCHWAKTGEEGLSMWRDLRPAIVLVDQLLPGLQGSDLVAAIRREDPQLPVLGITASAMGPEIEALEAAGATRAVAKPLSAAQLQEFCDLFLPR